MFIELNNSLFFVKSFQQLMDNFKDYNFILFSPVY